MTNLKMYSLLLLTIVLLVAGCQESEVKEFNPPPPDIEDNHNQVAQTEISVAQIDPRPPEPEPVEEVNEPELDSWPLFVGEHFRVIEDNLGVPAMATTKDWLYDNVKGHYHVHVWLRNKHCTKFLMDFDRTIYFNSRQQAIDTMAKPTEVISKQILTSTPWRIYGVNTVPSTTVFKNEIVVVWEVNGNYINLKVVRADDNIWRENSRIDSSGRKTESASTNNFPPSGYTDWNDYGIVQLVESDDFEEIGWWIKCE